MPAFLLPLLNPDGAHVEGEAEQLAAWAAPAFDSGIAARIGRETLVRSNGNRLLLQGERFPTRRGWVQGSRYLILGDHGRPIAVLNLTQRKEHGQRSVVVASNVYVDPEHRRQGLARALLCEAQRDHPRLRADASLSAAGAALIGYEPKARPRFSA